MRIVHVLQSLDCGGMERVVTDLTGAAKRDSHVVDVICLEKRGALAEEVESHGAAVYCLDKRPGLQFHLRKRIRTLLYQIKPDVVHTHTIGGLFYVGPVATRVRVPLIVHTEHGKHFCNAAWKERWLARYAGWHAHRFFCVSEDVAREVRSCQIVTPRKISVVYNGINTRSFATDPLPGVAKETLGLSPHAPVIGTVGRLSDVKCQDILIRAFARIKQELPDARLLIVGDGPLKTELEALAHQLNVAPSVLFMGYQQHCARFYEAMDVFVLTSRTEGTPLAVLEAFATGLPVIASNVGGLPELIVHGKNGLLFDRGNVAQLASQLISVISDADLADTLGRSARSIARGRFDTSLMCQTYMERYERDLLRRRGQNNPADCIGPAK